MQGGKSNIDTIGGGGGGRITLRTTYNAFNRLSGKVYTDSGKLDSSDVVSSPEFVVAGGDSESTSEQGV